MIDIFSDQSRKAIAEYIKVNKDRLEYNQKIFTILGGNLKTELEDRMLKDLGALSYAAARFRQSPINVLEKVVDKLTRIYKDNVIRTVEGGTEQDADLVAWYEETLQLNRKMSKNNENFNSYLYSLMHIALTDPDEAQNPGSIIRKPFIRSIPNHQFLVMNASETDPTSSDVIITCMEKRKRANGDWDEVYYITTKYQFGIINQNGEILTDLMLQKELDGSNPYGTAPYVYANGSEDCVMPEIQTDLLDMAVLVPLLLTDLNYAVKYQAFSVFVAIGLKSKDVQLSPNVIIEFDPDPGADGKASFETVKPTIDISETLSLASSQMSLWLSTKGIRPGQIGNDIGTDKFASGISKMIDESDTYEALKEQIIIYKNFEAQFWDKLLHKMHPLWVAAGVVENKTIFSPGARVVTEFAKPVPMQSRGDLVRDLDQEVNSRFISRKRALRKLNPEMTEADVDELISEIDEETPTIVPAVEDEVAV